MGSLTVKGTYLTCKISWDGANVKEKTSISAKLSGSLDYKERDTAVEESFYLYDISGNYVATIATESSKNGQTTASTTYYNLAMTRTGTFYVRVSTRWYGWDYDDGDWYSKNSSLTHADDSRKIVVVANVAPTAPTAIVVPALEAGKAAAISWDAATDPDGTIAAYELSRQVDGGAWALVGTTASLSMTDTIGEDWTTVAYRVRAKDNNAAWSGYTTSAAVEVEPACGAVVVIDGIERQLDELYCCVDGILRPISGAAGIDGVTREIF